VALCCQLKTRLLQTFFCILSLSLETFGNKTIIQQNIFSLHNLIINNLNIKNELRLLMKEARDDNLKYTILGAVIAVKNT
jgi:hypothetical protein